MAEHLRRCLTIGIVAVLLAGACSDDGEPDGGAGDGSGSASTPGSGGDGDGDRSSNAPTLAPTVASSASARGLGGSGQGTVLNVRLSEGDAIGGPSAAAVNEVDGRPLDADEIRAVTDRLPPWDDDESDTTDFNRPAETLPPPPHRRDY